MRRCMWSLVVVGLLGVTSALGQELGLLNDGVAGKARLHGLSMGGSKLTVTGKPGAPRGYVLSFAKASNERRMVAVELPVNGLTDAYKSLQATVRLTSDSGMKCRPAVYLHEASTGRIWFCAGGSIASGPSKRVGIAIIPKRFRMVKFMKPADGESMLDVSRIQRISFGVLVDGVGEGSLSIEELSLSTEPCRAAKPATLTLPNAIHWRGGADKSVKNIKYLDVKDGNDHVVRTEFTFPQNAHMFFLPTMRFPEMDYGLYTGIRLTYRAQLAPPLNSLLVMAQGTEGSYVFSGVKSTAEWKTVDLPFADCRGAGWLKSVKGKPLPVDNLTGLTVGCHGSAKVLSPSWIEVKKVELYP